ncbi:Ig-like domain-containing protein [Candidatus Poribacteria bacterium]
MTEVLRAFGLLMAASTLLWIVGCGGGNDDDDNCAEHALPTVTLSPNGGDIGSNTIVTATFNRPVTVTATGAYLTSTDNKVWTFNLPVGDGQAVTVEGTDSCGGSGSASATFNVGGHSHEPELDGIACDPKDGAEDVDPADVSEITLVFSEDLASAEIINFEPDATIDYSVDGDTVTISFLGGFTLSQEVVVKLTAMDGAGNEGSYTYSFTTKAKE